MAVAAAITARQKESGILLFFKVVQVHLLNRVACHFSHPNTVVNHELRQLLAIDQHNRLVDLVDTTLDALETARPVMA